MIKFVPIFVCDFQLFAHPFFPPSFELRVEVAFVVGDVRWCCVYVSIAAVFGAVFAAAGLRFLSSSVFLPLLFEQRWLLLRPFVSGGVGEREVDGDGNLRIVFLSILRWPLLLPLLQPQSLLLVVAYALSVSKVSKERPGCSCTSLYRLSIPWLTIFTISLGTIALCQSLALSALVSTLRIFDGVCVVAVVVSVFCFDSVMGNTDFRSP